MFVPVAEVASAHCEAPCIDSVIGYCCVAIVIVNIAVFITGQQRFLPVQHVLLVHPCFLFWGTVSPVKDVVRSVLYNRVAYTASPDTTISQRSFFLFEVDNVSSAND